MQPLKGRHFLTFSSETKIMKITYSVLALMFYSTASVWVSCGHASAVGKGKCYKNKLLIIIYCILGVTNNNVWEIVVSTRLIIVLFWYVFSLSSDLIIQHSSEIRGLCLMWHFQICHTFRIQKPTCFFFVFHVVLLWGFSYSKSMENFEAFCWNISSSINLLFLKSDKNWCCRQ